MLNRKASLYALMFVALISCTKEESSPLSDTINKPPSQELQSQQVKTIFGLLDAQSSVDETQARMNAAGISLVRLPVFLSQTTIGRTVDQYLQDGFNIQVNLNWMPTGAGPIAFPKDITKVKQQADAFFKYYQPFKNQIPIIVVENEWDNINYHYGNIQDYLNELSAIVEIGHQYGFKIADAGITSTTLQRWMYSQLSGDAATDWKTHYFVGLHNNYDAVMKLVNTYIAGIKTINIDYSNVHWYNSIQCNGGFALASQTYMQACGKTALICNEFGIRTNSVSLFDSTVSEIKNNARYGIAYSGVNEKGKAVELTGDMLGAL